VKPLRFILAGPGAVGLSLAAAWVRAGHHCVGLYGRGPRSLARGSRLLKARIIRHGKETSEKDFDVLLIAVPDAAIAATARVWARLPHWKGKSAFHTSGALSSRLLSGLREKGARVASLHPLTSIPRPSGNPRLFEGITFALEGDSTACVLGARVTRQVGGRPLRISSQAKAAYHLAACLSSGYLLAYLVMASELLEKAGGLARQQSFPPLLELASATLGNARRLGVRPSLTGPIVRGDLVTLRLHAKALKKAPPAVGLIYAVVAKKLVELVNAGGREKLETVRRIEALLSRLEGKRSKRPAG
jgi:predicted short-subunit dehydrogenase-like oxidoreductase (DUF2520 family)